MTRYLAIALLGTSLVGLPLFIGCDKDKDTKSVDVETKNADGSKTIDKEKTTTDENTGATKTTTEHQVTAPSTTQPSSH